MTNSEDQNVPGDDATTVVPSSDSVADGDRSPTVSLDKADDAAAQAPYYESEWSPAYAQTEIRSTSPFEAPAASPVSDDQPNQPPYSGVEQPGFAQPGYGQPGYGQPGYPASAPPPPAYGYGTPYPSVGPPVYGSAQGPAPQFTNGSAIAALVISALLVIFCYTAVIGIAPLVLSIMSITKGNSVSNLWYMGYPQAAYDAMESSKNMARWAWFSMAIGIGVVLLIVAIIVVIVAANS